MSPVVEAKITSQAAYEVPANQQAAVMSTHNAPLEIRNDWPVVQPADLKPGEVLVRIVASGVCHTCDGDLLIWKGDFPAPSRLPLVGGHEGAGYVAAIGRHTDTELKVGDAVGVRPTAKTCMSCEECRKGFESVCTNSTCHGWTVDGCFAQYVVAWASHVSSIPVGMSLFEAAPILCAGVTVFKALKTATLTAGESVVIVGAAGALGHLAIQYARVMGYNVIAIDTGADKIQLCKDLGAKRAIDFKTTNVVEEVMKATDGGAHAAIVVATGNNASDQAIEYLRPNGALLVVALPTPDAVLTAPVFTTVIKSLRILGTCTGNRQDTIEALKIASTGRVKAAVQVEPFKALPKVYDKIESSTLVGKVVLDLQ